MSKRIWDEFLTEKDKRIYQLSGYGKRLKAKDRRLYYALKYTTLAVLTVSVIAGIAAPYV